MGLPTDIPTEEELKPIRVLYVALVGDLNAAGLTSTVDMPAKKKLMRYMLAKAGKDLAEEMTHNDWANFFQETNAQIVAKGIQSVITDIEAAPPLPARTVAKWAAIQAEAVEPQPPPSRTGTALQYLDQLVAELSSDAFSMARAGEILRQLRTLTPRGRWTDMVRATSDRILKADIPWVQEWLKTRGRYRHSARSMDRLLTKMEFIARRPNAKGASHYPVVPKVLPKVSSPTLIYRSISEQERQQAFEKCERARMRAAIATFDAEFQP